MPEKNTCPKCGKPFHCEADTGSCWCQAYQLDEKTLKHLENTYPDCLCEDCLKGFAQNNQRNL